MWDGKVLAAGKCIIFNHFSELISTKNVSWILGYCNKFVVLEQLSICLTIIQLRNLKCVTFLCICFTGSRQHHESSINKWLGRKASALYKVEICWSKGISWFLSCAYFFCFAIILTAHLLLSSYLLTFFFFYCN